MAGLPPLELKDIQGDVLVGLSKKTEIFHFFQIKDAKAFKPQLKNLVPHITTADKATGEKEEIKRFRVQRREKVEAGDANTAKAALSIVGVNISFSHLGLVQLIGEAKAKEINDDLFIGGQKKDAKDLHDRGKTDGDKFTPAWDAAFLKDIHGVILITGDSFDSVSQKLNEVKRVFSKDGVSSITDVATLAGDVRPGDQKGHEHFGYKDGISNPRVDVSSLPKALPGQTTIKQGVALLGRPGDDVAFKVGTPVVRPKWALDGSFLAFRKLPQLVPEFDKFLVNNAKTDVVNQSTPNVFDDFPDAPSATDILGARFVGRWKSGAPIRATPLADDLKLATDELRNNKFRFNKNSQEACPFAAHIRKMNPRKDVDQETGLNPHLILRRGIPFGPEVTSQEKVTNSTQHERGLYFVSYQSNLANGFSFLQKAWANNSGFPIGTTIVPGLDPLIGQEDLADPKDVRDMSGYDDDDVTKRLKFDRRWVESKGGEYFFSPSIPTLSEVLTTATPS
ncbi:hypothetical protein BDV96DRAFT_531454 [Lophiotrema nucula]|uniref:Dyp-type peroxidase n=1 Tax=Lophiotrema nucula TaxID=690887 RepID=A0A6A5YLZ7_9PLEO|nr:hypothetical protein BDV96DRAFT_531454 [Lophiotrema nucula]